jgi:head-tail adaptor
VPIDYSAKGGVIAGDLRYLVAYESCKDGEPSSYGDAPHVWRHMATLWADLTQLEGSELMRAHEVHAQAKVQIVIHHHPGVTFAGRFVFEGEHYYPASINSDPLKRKMTCICYVRPLEKNA